VQRILLGNALIASFGGVPLIYMGDEIAMTNDYTYLYRPTEAHDSRWIHRPHMDCDRVARAKADPETAQGQVLAGTRQIFARRKATEYLHGANACRIRNAENDAIFTFQRIAATGTLLCLFNFTQTWQHLSGQWLRDLNVAQFYDALSDSVVDLDDDVFALPPYGRVWLT